MRQSLATVSGEGFEVPLEQPLDFEQFFRDIFPVVYRALCLATGNRHEAEDVVQEAFARVWERWDEVRTMGRPDGYLYRAAMNAYLSRRRRAAVALRKTARLLPADDPMQVVEDRDELMKALAILTPRQRAAMVLTEFLDLTSEEAGQALGVKAATVRVLTNRARSAFRNERGGSDG